MEPRANTMSMVVSHLIRHLVLPPGSLLILATAGLLLQRRHQKAGRGLVVASLVILYLVSTPLVAGVLMGSLETEPALTPEKLEQARPEAIVVLGGGIYTGAPEFASYGGLTTSHSSTYRTRCAARLHHATGLPVFCFGGGGHPPAAGTRPVSEAAAMRDLLIEMGVPAEQIRLESTSSNTWQNALYGQRLLREQNIERVLLVTSSYHSPRARFCFERLGFEVTSAPTGLQDDGYWSQGLFAVLPQAAALDTSSKAMEEWCGRIFYRLRYSGYRPEQEQQSP